jgi:hypothetical protein
MSNTVTIELSGDEALVLFHWLAEMYGAKLDLDDAEQRVFLSIQASLERSLVEPFAKNYLELVERARQRILEK